MSEAAVAVDGREIARIGAGLLVLVGGAVGDVALVNRGPVTLLLDSRRTV